MDHLPLVVGAVILDCFPNATKVLAARRTQPPELAGRWEFPGGKVEVGETPRQALKREVAEELAIAIEVFDELPPPIGETWPASNGYVMKLYLAKISQGLATPQDSHDAVRWLARDQLHGVEWLDSDRDALRLLPLGPNRTAM
jgi:8-oxo-dGTP diphosphatase